MDSTEAFRLVNNVLNLQRRVGMADDKIAKTERGVDKARLALMAVEEAKADAVAQRDALIDQLDQARIAAEAIPAELVAAAAAEASSKLNRRQAIIDALATATTDEDIDAIVAALARPGSASAGAEGNAPKSF